MFSLRRSTSFLCIRRIAFASVFPTLRSAAACVARGLLATAAACVVRGLATAAALVAPPTTSRWSGACDAEDELTEAMMTAREATAPATRRIPFAARCSRVMTRSPLEDRGVTNTLVILACPAGARERGPRSRRTRSSFTSNRHPRPNDAYVKY